jgi:chromosome segregation ATPase
MFEPIVYVGIGFVIALAIALSRRTLLRTSLARRALRRLETSAPSLMADIEADMSHLHGQIAIATRRLEMSVAQMRQQTTNQLAEIGKTSEAIARLKAEHGERSAVVAAVEAKQTAVTNELCEIEAELAVKSEALVELEEKLAERRAEFARFMAQYNVHPELARAQKLHEEEVERLKAESANLEAQLDIAKKENVRIQQDMAQIRKQVETTWASERMANAVLRERINDVATEVVRVAVALEGLSMPIDKLVAGNPANGTDGALLVEGNGDATAHAGNGDDPRSSLATRIRSLRRRAAQVAADT